MTHRNHPPSQSKQKAISASPGGTGPNTPVQAPPATENAQTGGTRAPKHLRSSGHPHNTSPAGAAFEGGLHTRVFEDPGKQGISSRSGAAESAGQRKVVNRRSDARAGLDHSSGHPR